MSRWDVESEVWECWVGVPALNLFPRTRDAETLGIMLGVMIGNHPVVITMRVREALQLAGALEAAAKEMTEPPQGAPESEER